MTHWQQLNKQIFLYVNIETVSLLYWPSIVSLAFVNEYINRDKSACILCNVLYSVPYTYPFGVLQMTEPIIA